MSGPCRHGGIPRKCEVCELEERAEQAEIEVALLIRKIEGFAEEVRMIHVRMVNSLMTPERLAALLKKEDS